MHRLELANHCAHRLECEAPRPVMYNSWEATEFNVNEPGQVALAEKASKLGVELFVMDDGWFGMRNDDHAGLGDWEVNPEKFPHGLKPLIAYVHALGMDFGLWVEPEMVNPDSDLYREHPDWVMSFPGRARTEPRNQLVLNLARDDVKAYVFDVLDRLVSEYDIATFSSGTTTGTSRSRDGRKWRGRMQKESTWRTFGTFTTSWSACGRSIPNLEIESCSGGGGRVDLAVLRYSRRILDFGQYGCFRPPDHSGRLHPCLRRGG